MFIGKYIFVYLPQPFYHKKFLISCSQSGWNPPWGRLGGFWRSRGR